MLTNNYHKFVTILRCGLGCDSLADTLIDVIQFELVWRHNQLVPLWKSLFLNDVDESIFELDVVGPWSNCQQLLED